MLISGRLAAQRITGTAGASARVPRRRLTRASWEHGSRHEATITGRRTALPDAAADASARAARRVADTVDAAAPPSEPAPRRVARRFGAPAARPAAASGSLGSLMMVVGGFGAGGVLVRDPLLTQLARSASGATGTAASSPACSSTSASG